MLAIALLVAGFVTAYGTEVLAKDFDLQTAQKGDLIIITDVTLGDSGGVALCPVMRDGKPGLTINWGRVRFLRNDHDKLVVLFKRDIKSEATILAMQYCKFIMSYHLKGDSQDSGEKPPPLSRVFMA